MINFKLHYIYCILYIFLVLIEQIRSTLRCDFICRYDLTPFSNKHRIPKISKLIKKHRHAMRAWAILWNVDKTGRSEKMVEWWVIYLWCFSFLLWCWRSMSKMVFLLLLFSFLICKIDFEFDLHQTNCHSPRIFWNKRFINSAKIDI